MLPLQPIGHHGHRCAADGSCQVLRKMIIFASLFTSITTRLQQRPYRVLHLNCAANCVHRYCKHVAVVDIASAQADVHAH
jgi:hypothetical protein